MASVRRQVFAQARQPSAENREQQTANVGNRNELITAVYCSTQFEYQRRWCLTGCSRLAQVAAERGEEPVVGTVEVTSVVYAVQSVEAETWCV
jgi:hypothetical protein